MKSKYHILKLWKINIESINNVITLYQIYNNIKTMTFKDFQWHIMFYIEKLES